MKKRDYGLTFSRREKKITNQMITDILSWIFVVFLAVFLAYVLARTLGTRIEMAGTSMEPGLHNRQVVYVNRVIYSLIPPRTGDVIVFTPNGNANQLYSVKRVVGVPGDTVQIRNGKLYINGDIVDNYRDNIADAGIVEERLVLGEDEFFVMGDNPNSSEDSRSANIGPVKRTEVLGKAWLHMAGGDEGIGKVE
ncbi:MAG: signal peptidase I [Lachnospiraceae bacterium]|nr:signal peptidase I [Lachnospiraceae bacterium]